MMSLKEWMVTGVAAFLLMIGLTLVATEDVCGADVNLAPGSSVTVNCKAGAAPPPVDPDPPTGCADIPVRQVIPWTALETQVKLQQGKTTALRFRTGGPNPSKVQRITIVPHFSGTPRQSKLHTSYLSECPGDFDWRNAGQCFVNGSEGSIRFVVGGTSRYCALKPRTLYFLNIAAVHPATLKPVPACGGNCGVLVKGRP